MYEQLPVGLGLRIITLNSNFLFSIDGIKKIENTVIFHPEANTALYQLYSIFSKLEKNEIENTDVLKLEPFIKLTNEMKEKCYLWIEYYKGKLPKLKAIKKKFESIKDNEFIFITSAHALINTNTSLIIYENLFKLNNRKEFNTDLFKDFTLNYNIFSYGEKRINIGISSKDKRVCRWCKKTKNSTPIQANFKKKAHAITEALGNKKIILFEECDKCNEKFGETIEQSIINYFSFFNTFWGVKGKNGIPKLKDGTTQIVNKGNRKISINLSQGNFEIKNGIPSKIIIPTNKKVIMQDIYKSLCKYALSVVESKDILSKFDYIIKWINGEKKIKTLPIIKGLSTQVFFTEEPRLILYIRKTNNKKTPLMFAEFRYKNILYIYIVPSSEEELKRFLDTNNYDTFWNSITHYKNISGWKSSSFNSIKETKMRFNINLEKNSDETDIILFDSEKDCIKND